MFFLYFLLVVVCYASFHFLYHACCMVLQSQHVLKVDVGSKSPGFRFSVRSDLSPKDLDLYSETIISMLRIRENIRISRLDYTYSFFRRLLDSDSQGSTVENFGMPLVSFGVLFCRNRNSLSLSSPCPPSVR